MADDLTKGLDALQKQFAALSGSTATAGAGTEAQGTDALQNMLQHFTQLSQGSSSTLFNTLPETQTVLSQYDAARNSMANLQPRGGMRASQGANLKFQELGQMGQLVQGARAKASDEAAATAGTLTQAGLSEQVLAEQYVNSVMQSMLQRRQQNKTSAGSTFANALAGGFGSGVGGGIANLLI